MILFACDEGPYLLNQTSWAIRSISQVMPQQKILLILINGTDRYLSQIKAWHDKIEVVNYEPKFSISYQDPGFFFSFKVLVLEEALRLAKEPILFLDGDIIVRKSLDTVFNILKEHDLTARYRPYLETPGPMGSNYSGRVNSGVIGLAYNQNSLDFARALRCNTEEFLENGGSAGLSDASGKLISGIDQEALWINYLNFSDKISFFPLPDSCNDSYYRRDSEIWHSKGVKKDHVMYKYSVEALDSEEGAKIRYAKELLRQQKFEDTRTQLLNKLSEKFFSGEKVMRFIESLQGCEKLLVVNSDFLTHNTFPDNLSIDCIDVDPVIYYKNREKLLNMVNVNHRFEILELGIELNNYQSAILDHTKLNLPEDLQILSHQKNISSYMQWNGPIVTEPEVESLIEGLFSQKNC